MNEDKFLNNPFLKLDAEQFPLQYKSQKKSEKELETEKENDFFLKNVDKFNPLKKKRLSGFSLTELGCNMDSAKHIKKNDNKKKDTPVETKKNVLIQNLNIHKKEENEQFLWEMRNTQPLKPGGRMIKPNLKRHNSSENAESFESLLADNLEFALLNGDEYIEGYVKGLDESILNKLRIGKFGVEAHLDLHGLNSMQAFEALRNFIRNCWFKGLKTVLLVPGRGHNSPNGISVLKQKLQYWLTHDPFKGVVLAFCTALPKDGGPGSIYVLLRNNRKKGRIYWERLPPDPDLYI